MFGPGEVLGNVYTLKLLTLSTAIQLVPIPLIHNPLLGLVDVEREDVFLAPQNQGVDGGKPPRRYW